MGSLKNLKYIFYKRTAPQIRMHIQKLIFLFHNQNVCCGYSKEPSHGDGSFEHPKQMLRLMDKNIFMILR